MTDENNQAEPAKAKRSGWLTTLRLCLKGIWATIMAAPRWITMMIAVLSFSWMVASQTVEWAANLTRMALSAVGAPTISQTADRATKRTADPPLEAESNAHADIRARAEASERRLRDSEAELASSRRQVAALEADLDLSQRQLREMHETNALMHGEIRRLDDAAHVNFGGTRMTVREAADTTVGRVQRRITQVSTANLSATWAESIPFYGIAVVVAATSFELSMACLDMQDLYELEVALNPEAAIPDDRNKVCGLQVPSAEEIWAAIKASPRAVWELSKDGLNAGAAGVSSIAGAARDRIQALEAPDFSDRWERLVSWAVSWFE